MSIFELPSGADAADPRWQSGYSDGFDVAPPRSDNPIYVSGWCHGYCGAFQADDAEAVEAYHGRRVDKIIDVMMAEYRKIVDERAKNNGKTAEAVASDIRREAEEQLKKFYDFLEAEAQAGRSIYDASLAYPQIKKISL